MNKCFPCIMYYASVEKFFPTRVQYELGGEYDSMVAITRVIKKTLPNYTDQVAQSVEHWADTAEMTWTWKYERKVN